MIRRLIAISVGGVGRLEGNEKLGIEISTVYPGAAQAHLDQVKAEAMDLLKESECFSLIGLNKEKTSCEIHSFVIDQHQILPFFSNSAIRSIQALCVILKKDTDETLEFIKDLIDQGWNSPGDGDLNNGD